MEVVSLFILEIFVVILLRIFCESVLTPKHIKKTHEVLIWVCYFGVSNLLTYIVKEIAWVNIIIFLVSFFLTVRLLYQNPTRTLLGVTVFIYIGGMCSEMIVYYGKDLIQPDMRPDNDVWYMVISKLVWFIVLKVTAMGIKLTQKVELSVQDWLEVFIVPVSSIFILLALSTDNVNNENLLIVQSVILILIINIFTYYIYDKAKENMSKKLREEILEKQCEYYISQYNESQEWWQELRRFRHDMKQHYLLEKAYLEAGDYAAMLKYCNENLDFVNRSHVVSNTGNLYFDSIINYKADVAKLYDSEIVPDINIPVDIKVQPEDLSMCLGNLLDNAIEATKELPEDKKIYLQICVDGSNLFIDVRNKYHGHRQKVNEKYLTGKKDAKQHGYGLDIINQIVEKYEGDLQIKDDNNEFEVEVVLYQFIL